MYVIVNKSKLRGKYFGVTNTLPDGRVYFPIGEIRSVGTLLNVDIIGSARELKELIEKQIEEGITPPDIDPDFGIDPDSGNVDPGFSVNLNPDPDFGKDPLPDDGDNSVTDEDGRDESSQENGDAGHGDKGETEEKEPNKARGGKR